MLKDKLKQDSFNALKARDQRKVDVLRFLISLIDKKELTLPPGSMNQAQEVAVMQKELKNKEESKEMFAKGGRNDLVEQMDYEIELLKSYLPAGLSEDEIRSMVKEAIVNQGTNFGMIMKEVVGKVAGRADGAIISKLVKEEIEASNG